ncbi:MAG: SDR family oxidoreductase [Chloroflexota bacterium]|nr:SDR family oxidoreductase [Chloroflexota bacterium]
MDEEYLRGLFGVEGKVIVLTGGAGVLCSCMARGLGRAGAKPVILDISQEAIDRLMADLKAEGVEALGLRTDVLKKGGIEAAAEKAMDTFGRVDVLINGAGGNRPEATTGPDLPFFDLPKDAVQWVFNLNFLSAFLCSQVFGKIMKEQGEGIILNISSMNAFRPLTRIPAYSAAKAAVSNFTQWLAVHMAQEYSPDIRVNAIAPGFFLTQQNRYLLIDEETGELTDRGQTITNHTPVGRFGDPEDLLGTVLWLLSPGSKFVSGIVVPIDGGFSAFSGV